jgi:hypothetical protein
MNGWSYISKIPFEVFVVVGVYLALVELYVVRIIWKTRKRTDD